MTQLNSKLFEIEQNHRDIEGQKALAAALVTALRDGDRETSLMYIPNEKAVDFLSKSMQKNPDFADQLMGDTYATNAEPAFNYTPSNSRSNQSLNTSVHAGMDEALNDYNLRNVGIAVMLDYADDGLQREQDERNRSVLRNVAQREYGRNALSFAQQEAYLNDLDGVEDHTHLNPQALRHATQTAHEFTSHDDPRNKELVLDTLPHLDKHIPEKQKFWNDEQSRGYEAVKNMTNDALQGERKGDVNLTQMAYRNDMVQHEMPNGFYRAYQDEMAQMKQFHEQGKIEDYQQSLQKVKGWGNQMAATVVDPHTQELKQPKIYDSMAEIKQHGLEQNPELGPNQKVQHDIAQAMSEGFEERSGVALNKSTSFQQSPAQMSAVAAIDFSRHGVKKQSDVDDEGGEEVSQFEVRAGQEHTPELKPSPEDLNKSLADKKFVQGFKEANPHLAEELKSDCQVMGISTDWQSRQDIENAQAKRDMFKHEMGGGLGDSLKDTMRKANEQEIAAARLRLRRELASEGISQSVEAPQPAARGMQPKPTHSSKKERQPSPMQQTAKPVAPKNDTPEPARPSGGVLQASWGKVRDKVQETAAVAKQRLVAFNEARKERAQAVSQQRELAKQSKPEPAKPPMSAEVQDLAKKARAMGRKQRMESVKGEKVAREKAWDKENKISHDYKPSNSPKPASRGPKMR